MSNRVDSYRHILKYTGLFGGVQGLNILVGVVKNKCVALILGPDGMGLLSLFNSTIRFLSDSTNLGLGMSGVKTISEKYQSGDEEGLTRAIKTVRSWGFITALLGMLLCVVLSPLLDNWTFSWGDHTLHFILLSPVVALLAITGCETAILKALRQLKKLAKISVYSVLGSFVLSVPLYYFYGESGIVPSLLLVALLQMLLTIGYSYRLHPLDLSLKTKFLVGGVDMIKLGVAFVLAGIMGSGAEFLIRSFLSHESSLVTLGLYNAGYMMTMTYGGMVFSAMETDYFPRLSAINALGREFNDCVNRQIEVSLLLISPMLAAFITFTPVLLPLLYSGKFLPVLGMIQVAALALYLRAIKLPISYIPLGRGDSKSFLLMEAIYDVALVGLMILSFRHWGLLGTGIAITLCAMLDFIVLLVYMHWRFGYTLSRQVMNYALVQLPLGVLTFGATLIHNSVLYWVMGILLTGVSLGYSLLILKRKTHLWESLKRRWKR